MGLFSNNKVEKSESTGFEDHKVSGDFSGLSVPDVDYFEGEESSEVGGGVFAKIHEGENYILMLPSNDVARKTPWKEYGQHFLCSPMEKDKIIAWLGLEEWPEIVEKSYACSLDVGRCYWHELVKKLADSKRNIDKNLSKKWFGKTRYLSNVVVVLSDGNKVVKPFPFGKTIKDDLVLAVKQDKLKFYDPEALIPIRITRIGSGFKTDYKTKVMENAKRVKMMNEWKEAMRDLNSLLPPRVDTIAEMEQIAVELNLFQGDSSSGGSSGKGGTDKYGFGGSRDSSDEIPF